MGDISGYIKHFPVTEPVEDFRIIGGSCIDFRLSNISLA